MFPLLLVSGCMAPWGNSLRATDEVPFTFGEVTVALWVEDTDEDRDDIGWAWLLMSTGDLGCDELEDTETELDVFWQESGVLVMFTWSNSPFDPGEDGRREGENVGWEGTYYQAMSVGKSEQDGITTRDFASTLFADGTAIIAYDGGGYGTADVTRRDPDEVVGHIQTDTYQARFQAENCGELEEDVSYDTAW